MASKYENHQLERFSRCLCILLTAMFWGSKCLESQAFRGLKCGNRNDSLSKAAGSLNGQFIWKWNPSLIPQQTKGCSLAGSCFVSCSSCLTLAVVACLWRSKNVQINGMLSCFSFCFYVQRNKQDVFSFKQTAICTVYKWKWTFHSWALVRSGARELWWVFLFSFFGIWMLAVLSFDDWLYSRR